MNLPKKRQVIAIARDGHIRLVKQEIPAVDPGSVLVEVHASLVSPGKLTGWRGFSEMRKNPGREAGTKLFSYTGYSNAGIVLDVGDGVTELHPGDRVACVGHGYASHSDYAVVPHNLCVPLPDAVTFTQGSYAMLAATGVQALRRGDPDFGEYTAVLGLGLVGQLTAQLYKLAGNYVTGWDIIRQRTEIALKWGIDATVNVAIEDEVEETKRFTGGYGLDSAVLAFGGDTEQAVKNVEKCMKVSPDGHAIGTLVVVGSAHFPYTGSLTNMDIRRASRTGPGYHDESWERGPSYPPVFMRWTTQSNLKLCMRLIAEGRLKVDCLTTHIIPLQRVDEEISVMVDDPDSILGVVFTSFD